MVNLVPLEPVPLELVPLELVPMEPVPLELRVLFVVEVFWVAVDLIPCISVFSSKLFSKLYSCSLFEA